MPTSPYSFSALTPEDYASLLMALLPNTSDFDVVRRMPLVCDEYGALGTTDELGLMAHQGRLFMHSGIHLGLGAGAAYYHLLDNSSSDAHGHLRMAKISAGGGPFWIQLYEDTQVTSLGTAASVVNMNRSSTRTAKMQLFEGTTVSSDGAHIYGDIIPGTQQQGGIAEAGVIEYLLAPGKRYGLNVTNKSAQSQDWSLILLGHE